MGSLAGGGSAGAIRPNVSAALITAGAKDDTPSWRLAAQEILDCV
jgi:hypothetical protein